jgi:hypothetical protein
MHARMHARVPPGQHAMPSGCVGEEGGGEGGVHRARGKSAGCEQPRAHGRRAALNAQRQAGRRVQWRAHVRAHRGTRRPTHRSKSPTTRSKGAVSSTVVARLESPLHTRNLHCTSRIRPVLGSSTAEFAQRASTADPARNAVTTHPVHPRKGGTSAHKGGVAAAARGEGGGGGGALGPRAGKQVLHNGGQQNQTGAARARTHTHAGTHSQGGTTPTRNATHTATHHAPPGKHPRRRPPTRHRRRCCRPGHAGRTRRTRTPSSHRRSRWRAGPRQRPRPARSPTCWPGAAAPIAPPGRGPCRTRGAWGAVLLPPPGPMPRQ